MTETTEQKISRLEDDVARLREENKRVAGERDEAVALAVHARNHLLSGADEKTHAGKFWANETRHAFSGLGEAAVARILADEVDRLGVEIAYDDEFYTTTGDTSSGMRRAVKITVARSVSLRAREVAVGVVRR